MSLKVFSSKVEEQARTLIVKVTFCSFSLAAKWWIQWDFFLKYCSMPSVMDYLPGCYLMKCILIIIIIYKINNFISFSFLVWSSFFLTPGLVLGFFASSSSTLIQYTFILWPMFLEYFISQFPYGLCMERNYLLIESVPYLVSANVSHTVLQ